MKAEGIVLCVEQFGEGRGSRASRSQSDHNHSSSALWFQGTFTTSPVCKKSGALSRNRRSSLVMRRRRVLEGGMQMRSSPSDRQARQGGRRRSRICRQNLLTFWLQDV